MAPKFCLTLGQSFLNAIHSLYLGTKIVPYSLCSALLLTRAHINVGRRVHFWVAPCGLVVTSLCLGWKSCEHRIGLAECEQALCRSA